jgi:DNA-binding MarR family transcriptional regulator
MRSDVRVAVDDERRALGRRLADEVGRLVRLGHAARAAVAARGAAPVPAVGDRSAVLLLFPLLVHGPQRASALADAVHADPSTVSRQTAELVRHGLVRREEDPTDRRARLLALTDAGREVCERVRATRGDLLAAALATWSREDLGTLATLLHRLNEDLAADLGVAVRPVPTTDRTDLQENA